MRRLRFVAPLLVLGLLTSGFLMGEDKTKEEPIIVKAQLPRYYKQLGLSDKQKREVYQVRAKYAVEIDKLKKQIAVLQEREKGDLENVLSDAQKARLQELRGGGPDKPKKPADEKPTEINKKK